MRAAAAVSARVVVAAGALDVGRAALGWLERVVATQAEVRNKSKNSNWIDFVLIAHLYRIEIVKTYPQSPHLYKGRGRKSNLRAVQV